MYIKSITRGILSVMLKYRGYHTTGRIARLAGISWNTAEKYLYRLERKGWIVRKQRRGDRIYWKAVR